MKYSTTLLLLLALVIRANAECDTYRLFVNDTCADACLPADCVRSLIESNRYTQLEEGSCSLEDFNVPSGRFLDHEVESCGTIQFTVWDEDEDLSSWNFRSNETRMLIDGHHHNGRGCGTTWKADVGNMPKKFFVPRGVKTGRKAFENDVTVTIRTRFFVVRKDEDPNSAGNVPEHVIEMQTDVLNKAFEGTGIQFQKRRKSVRYASKWYHEYAMNGGAAEKSMKGKLKYSARVGYLNVWLVSGGPSGTLGYAYFPSDIPEKHTAHGVVMDFNTLPGGSLGSYNLGDTLVHEVGHWLGLSHTWGDGGGCNDDDHVDDTPVHAEPNYECVNEDSCPNQPGPDPIRNYMNYGPDSCITEFTAGQIERMQSAMCEFKPRLLKFQNVECYETDIE